MQYLWVGIGGFFGAIARYGVGRQFFGLSPLQGPAFPWATLIVNVAGSLVIGFIAALLAGRSAGSEEMRLLVMVGFLGAFTTFSSFSLETLNLFTSGAWVRAAMNVFANMVLCLVAVAAGYTVARQLAVS